MTTRRAIPLVQMPDIGCVVIIASASQACSPRSDDVDPDQVTHVTEAIAGDCGHDPGICLVRSAVRRGISTRNMLSHSTVPISVTPVSCH